MCIFILGQNYWKAPLIKFLGTESIALQLFSHNTEINKSNRVDYAFPFSV